MSPKLLDYHKLYLGWIEELRGLGDTSEATFLARRLIELYPSEPDCYCTLARCLEPQSDLSEALSFARHAVRLDPAYQLSYVTLAKLLRKAGDPDTTPFENKLVEYPFWIDLRLELAEWLTDLKQPAKAAAHLRLVNQENPNYKASTVLANTLASIGERDEAMSIVNSSLANPLGTIEGVLDIASTLQRLGDVGAAHQLLQELVRLTGPVEKILLAWSDLLLERGMAGDAVTLLQSGFQNAETPKIRHKIRDIQSRFPELRAKPHVWRRQRDKRIVFVSERPKIREAKLAYGLRQLGWEVILLHTEVFNGEPEKYFDATIRFQGADQALHIVEGLDSNLFHVFSAAVDKTILTFLDHRPGIIIFDTIDVFDGLIHFNHELMAAQRFCFENSDALVCRDLQVAESNRLSGKTRCEEVLFFPEYCWNFNQSSPPVTSRNEEIHLVQGGWINLEPSTSSNEATYLDIFTQLVEHGLHVHMYAHMMIGKDQIEQQYAEFLKLGSRTGRAHLHQTLPFDRMPHELAQYDFGVSIVPPRDHPGRSSKFPKSRSHFSFCGSARNTDYYDASLPVLVSPVLEFQCYTTKRYGLPVALTDAVLADPLTALRPYCGPAARREAFARRVGYSIDKHTPRLARFYTKLQKKFGMI